jgi:hypothetical protein
MSTTCIFRYFKTSPEIIRLAVMMSACLMFQIVSGCVFLSD